MVPIITGARRGKPSLTNCAVKSAKELATESEAKRQKLEEEKKMMDEIPENVEAIMRAMNANTVSAIGAISTELAPKLDLMTAKIDEHNKTMTSHKKDVERNMKKMEKKLMTRSPTSRSKLMMEQRRHHPVVQSAQPPALVGVRHVPPLRRI